MVCGSSGVRCLGVWFLNFILKRCRGGFGEMVQDEKMVSRKLSYF